MADLCKHHELILQYAEDAQKSAEPWKLWQVESWCGGWVTLGAPPQWSVCRKYRRKPRTIRIGEYDVPEPIRVEPLQGESIYIVDPGISSYCRMRDYRADSIYTTGAFKRGLVHTTPEAAELHGRALASLTEGK